MDSFDAKIEKACKDGAIPGAVLVASSADGKFRYEKAFAVRSLKDGSPMQTDATMCLASCTKLLTTVAAMQCVEKGLLNLDDDVTGILPELKDREILTGFEEGTKKPILVKNMKKITLRYMLTHQSGMGYDVFNPILMQYQQYVGKVPSFGGSRSIVDSYDYPLCFEPGESWEYSIGVDWAGEMVMRVSKMSLDAYMQKYMWAPLRVKNITFFPKKSPELMSKLAGMSKRDCGTTMFGTAENKDAPLVYNDSTVWDMDSVACHGGGGGYASPVEYQKILHSICADDGKLLKSETIDEMFKPQLTEKAKAKMNELNQIEAVNQMFGAFPTTVDWGIGGIMNLEAFPGRSAGSIAWGGYPNLQWWIDRESKMSGIYASQLLPPGDIAVNDHFKAWNEALYEAAGIKEREKL